MTLYRRQGARPSPPKKKKCKKEKWLSEEALQIAEKQKPREKRKNIPI